MISAKEILKICEEKSIPPKTLFKLPNGDEIQFVDIYLEVDENAMKISEYYVIKDFSNNTKPYVISIDDIKDVYNGGVEVLKQKNLPHIKPTPNTIKMLGEPGYLNNGAEVKIKNFWFDPDSVENNLPSKLYFEIAAVITTPKGSKSFNYSRSFVYEFIKWLLKFIEMNRGK